MLWGTPKKTSFDTADADERLHLRSRRRPGVIFAREGIAMAAPKAKPEAEAEAADALWYGYYS